MRHWVATWVPCVGARDGIRIKEKGKRIKRGTVDGDGTGKIVTWVRGWWRSERVCGTVLGYFDVLASRAKRAVTGCFQGRGERLRRKMITIDDIASVILLVGDTRTAQEGRD
jgi:hypothetical protein